MMVDIMDIILWLLLIATSSRVSSTPLDDYVNRHDPTYTYSEVGDPEIDDGYTLHYINLTSQTWLTDNDSDRSIWWHYLVICIPHDIELSGSAFMYITGGSNSGTGRPDKESADMLLTTALCITTGSVTAALFQIPNQPIVFTDDPIQKRRSEDSIIAYTWYHYMMRKQDPEWLLRLPMTKAAVRAMDTITDFTSKKNTALNINKFVVAGASKRGWTTWTTGAVDDRVIGIIPIVMDLLNMKKNLHHHYRSLGGWTFAFGDYYEMNITKNLDSPLMQDMADIVDPYSYIDHLTMPKLIISSSGDEFFLPDDNYYFLDDIKGETHIRVLPNDEHSCAAHAVGIMFDARAFYLSLVQGYPRPKMTWALGQNDTMGWIKMETDVKPTGVMMYHSVTAGRRDFRLLENNPATNKPAPHAILWFPTKLSPQADRSYLATRDVPSPGGWVGFFIQATFPGPSGSVQEYTTQVNIIPNTFPFADCHGDGCHGKLV